MLSFRKFEKRYGTFAALSIDKFDIEPGIYWIKGANGSGKSTLLKSIAGILSFKGDILLNDNISLKNDAVEYRRLINFAEAEPLFPPFLTGTEMIRLFAEAKGAPAGQEQTLINSMQMQAYVNRPVGTYSSGMLKKLSLLLAFLGKPDWILLDEPLITIDDASLKILYQWMARQYQEQGTSFLLTSHQALDAAELPVARGLLVHDHSLHML